MSIEDLISGQIRGYGLPQNEKNQAAKGARAPETQISANRHGVDQSIAAPEFAVLLQSTNSFPLQNKGTEAPSTPRLTPKQMMDQTVLIDPKDGQGPTAPKAISGTSDAGMPSSLVAQLMSEQKK